MRANLNSDLNAPKLARQIGVSVPHLSRRFRLALRSSPMAVLTELRMEWARAVLAERDLTQKEIAGQVGYKTTSAFGRAFLRSQGVTPGEMRRQWRRVTIPGGKLPKAEIR